MAGEGEHKIIDFIRQEKSTFQEVPTSHCIYGNDSDIIMLALVTHEPMITILRESDGFQSREQV